MVQDILDHFKRIITIAENMRITKSSLRSTTGSRRIERMPVFWYEWAHPVTKESAMNKPIELNVYGRIVLAVKSDEGWHLMYKGREGKNRPAHDLVVPDFIEETELVGYLSDLCHEWATVKFPAVYRIFNDA